MALKLLKVSFYTRIRGRTTRGDVLTLACLKGQSSIGSASHEFGAYLESLAAARHGSEDIVAVHGAEDQARAIPRLGAETAAYGLAAAALQTTHAHG